MNSFVLILLEASVAMVLFYLVYHAWLRKQTLFHLNRFYLLSAMLISLIIPVLNIPIKGSADVIVVYNLIETITVTTNAYEQSLLSTISAMQWVGYAYLLGVFISLIRFVIKLWQISRIAKNALINYSGPYPENVKFINADVVPFSFMNRMYINPNQFTDEQLRKIIAHETVHLNQLHTIDCLMYELLIILFWFNPIAYRYRNSAKEIHEYLADEGVVESEESSIEYQKLLFQQATGLGELKLANSFNYSLTKRRFIMMTKIKSGKFAATRLLWFLPVLFGVLLVFACSEQNDVKDSKTGLIMPEDLVKEAPEEVVKEGCADKVYQTVEDMPVFEGGDYALRKFIAQNIKYPEIAKKEGITGKVYIQFTVDKDGSVIDAIVLRSVHESIDKEALRVVSALPNWKPGKQDGKPVNVQFTVPINFQLN